MGFEGLLGNEQLKENLNNSLATGRTSHFYLISGPEGSGKHTLARLLAAALLCQSSSGKPCLHCPACRKVLENMHPDFITVDDPDKKTVTVDLVREARADIYIRPNEADKKIYLFPRAQDMRLEGQNALLKVLEEPPSYGVFLLLTDNPEKLLPTVRSRCVELRLTALPDKLLRDTLIRDFPDADLQAVTAAVVRSGGYLGQARALLEEGGSLPPQTENFLKSFSARDTMGLIQTLVPMEKWKRDQLIPMLQQWMQLLESAAACRAGMPAVSPTVGALAAARRSPDLLNAVEALRKAIDYAQGNVSPGAICGWLEWALRT